MRYPRWRETKVCRMTSLEPREFGSMHLSTSESNKNHCKNNKTQTAMSTKSATDTTLYNPTLYASIVLTASLIWIFSSSSPFLTALVMPDHRCHQRHWRRSEINISNRWVGDVVVRTLDLRPSRRWSESRSWHCLVISEIGDRFWQVNYLGMKPPPRSTQPCISPGSLDRVPASAGVKAGKSPLPGGRCDPISHVISRSGMVISITNCYVRVYFFTLLFHSLVIDQCRSCDI